MKKKYKKWKVVINVENKEDDHEKNNDFELSSEAYFKTQQEAMNSILLIKDVLKNIGYNRYIGYNILVMKQYKIDEIDQTEDFEGYDKSAFTINGEWFYYIDGMSIQNTKILYPDFEV